MEPGPDDPIAWENRLYRCTRPMEGWSVETWNPMKKVWERLPSAPYWPLEYEREAREWVEISNQDQKLLNTEVKNMFGI
jgi:hypothetical protein